MIDGLKQRIMGVVSVLLSIVRVQYPEVTNSYECRQGVGITSDRRCVSAGRMRNVEEQ